MTHALIYNRASAHDNECPIARAEGENDPDEIVKEKKIVNRRPGVLKLLGRNSAAD
jgi:hypothetical protein